MVTPENHHSTPLLLGDQRIFSIYGTNEFGDRLVTVDIIKKASVVKHFGHQQSYINQRTLMMITTRMEG